MTTLLGLIGALQGLILALAVASIRGPASRPNRALAMVVLALSVAVAAITAEHAGLIAPSVYAILVEYSATFLFAPAAWHYSNLVLGKRPGVPIWVHLLPAGAWLGYIAAYRVGWTTWRWLPPIALVVGYLALYTLAIGVRVVRHGSRPGTLLYHLRVLRLLVVALVAIHAAQVVRFLFRDVGALEDVVPITATLAIYVLAGVAFRQSRLFAGLEPLPLRRKYESSLATEQATETERRLLEVLEVDKPFLNENLTVADLAHRLKVPRAHLSQVINSSLRTNFSELVRRYRVAEAERMLADSSLEHLTVEAIGYEVGFRSRSAFHVAYKDLKGDTPAQARARMSSNRFEDTPPSQAR